MSRWLRSERPDAGTYDRRFQEAERAGQDMHGEASFVASLMPAGGSVLDAGCGTGRVAIELARRGYDTVGCDLDPGMLEAARSKAPQLEWFLADLADPDLASVLGADGPSARFDTVVAAGNVLIFLEPGSEGAVVRNLSRLLKPGGVLVAGFQLDKVLSLETYEEYCQAAGLKPDEQWATWDRARWKPGGGYVVVVHRTP